MNYCEPTLKWLRSCFFFYLVLFHIKCYKIIVIPVNHSFIWSLNLCYNCTNQKCLCHIGNLPFTKETSDEKEAVFENVLGQ